MKSLYVNAFDKALSEKARLIEKRAAQTGYPIDTDPQWIAANELPVRMQEGESTSKWSTWAEIAILMGQVLERVSNYHR